MAVAAHLTEGRLPPQDLDAEQSVLGAMLISEDAAAEVTEFLRSTDFYRSAHAEIYSAITELAERSQNVDQVTVSALLEQRGTLADVGGRLAVFALAEAVPVVGNAKRYAEIVREMSILRALIRVGNEVASMGYERPGEVRALLDHAEQKIYDVAQGSTTGDFSPIREPLDDAFKKLTELYEHGDGSGVTGVATGYKDLDRLTAGLQKSNLVILAARPSMGKTSLALNIAEHVAIQLQKPVALFSLEMSKEEIAQRMLCSVGRVDQARLREAKLEDGDWTRITGAMETLGGAPLYIDDTGALTVMEMRAKSRRLAARHGLALIVVDYIQLMQASTHTESRVQEISQISRSLKVLARDLMVPVLALSQLSRAVESRQDKRPVLSDLRESGAIEQDADLVAFIYRDAYYRRGEEGEAMRPDDPDIDLSEVIVAKHRNGPVGTVKLRFQPRYTRFVDDYAGSS